MSDPDLSILVVSWNTRDLLRRCLRSALDHLAGLTTEIIVVDNASSDGSAAMVEREMGTDTRVHLIANASNAGFARANNQAFAVSRGSFLAIVNSDIAFTGPAIPAMVEHLRRHPEAGIVSCDLRGVDGLPQHYHRAFPTLPIVFFSWTHLGRRIDQRVLGGRVRRRYLLVDQPRNGVQQVEQAAAACLLLRRDTVARIGGLFDERFPIYFNDVDLSRRVRNAGLEVHVLFDHPVLHYGGASLDQLPRAVRGRAFADALALYYDLHEPAWKRPLVRLLLSEMRRQAARRAGESPGA
jgi:GT2 family glycosyltransferase